MITCLLDAEALGDVAISVDATVSEEWPPTAHLLTVVQIHVNGLSLFFLVGGTIEQLTLWTGNETRSPKLYAMGKS